MQTARRQPSHSFKASGKKKKDTLIKSLPYLTHPLYIKAFLR